MTLNGYLQQAREGRYAIGHFNFATEDVLKAIVEAAKEFGAPCVMVGTSEGESEFVGLREAVALVQALREDMQYPIFLNADHFKSFEKCKAAIDAGYDSIIADGSKMSMVENIAKTLGCNTLQINIKATTSEGLGFAGTGKGMAAYASVLIKKK